MAEAWEDQLWWYIIPLAHTHVRSFIIWVIINLYSNLNWASELTDDFQYQHMHTIASHSAISYPSFNSSSLKDAGHLEKQATFHLLHCISGRKL